jgi:short-subunit dehydrogenase
MNRPPANPKNTSSSSSKGTALITGASRGIGSVYADRLAKRGYDLILVARSEAPLQALSARLRSQSGQSITALPADLNDRSDLAKVENTLRGDPSISMLVNNAGIASVTPLLDSDVEKMDAMIALNITSLTRLTYAAAPQFVARGAGTIINIASVVGLSPEALTVFTAQAKPSLSRLAIHCSASWRTKASAFKLSCRARRRPTSGKSLASPGRSSPRPSLCRRKTWLMRLW